MDYIDKLRVFRSVVEMRSFTRAADMHGLARPVVSRAVADLEARFGSRLLHRTTRQVSLTETAERIYERCAAVLDELDSLEAEAQSPTRGRRPAAARRAHDGHAEPAGAADRRLQVAHPKVRLDVTLTERPIDLVGEGYDIGIVVPYMLTNESTVVRLIERIPLVIVATPAYLRAHSRPVTPADLADHPFVPMSPSLRRPALSFRVDGNTLTVPFRFDISSNSPVFNREMVMHDFGIGVVPKTLVEASLRRARSCSCWPTPISSMRPSRSSSPTRTARCCPRRSRRSSTTRPPIATAKAGSFRRQPDADWYSRDNNLIVPRRSLRAALPPNMCTCTR